MRHLDLDVAVEGRFALALHLASFGGPFLCGYVVAEGVTTGGVVTAAWYDEAAVILLHNAQFVFVLFMASLVTCGVAGCALLAINGLAFGGMVGTTHVEEVWWVVFYAPVEVLSYACISMAAVRVSLLVVRWLRYDSAVVLGPVLRQVGAGVYGIVVSAWLEAWAILGAWA